MRVETLLPQLHSDMKALHGGVWDYRVEGPVSLDDEAEVHVRVRYGLESCKAIVNYRLIFAEHGWSCEAKVDPLT